MLSYLHVKNLALIDEAEVEFGPGLNILTGETGAGKSILMGSVNLALGQKVPKDIIRNTGEPAFVELLFTVENDHCLKMLENKDIYAEDGQIIISRKITENRSICRINGEVCTAALIKEIAGLLLDIHGQHEHQSLLYQDRQLAILDSYGKDEISNKKDKVREIYKVWKEIRRDLEEFHMDEETRKREISFLEFEIGQIEEAQLVPGEDQELERQYKTASNSKNMLETLGKVQNYIGEDAGAGDGVGRALVELGRIENCAPQISSFTSMLLEIESLLQDADRDISAYCEDITFSDEEFYQMDSRLNLLNELKAKYGNTVEEILENLKKKQEKLDRLYEYEENKKKLEKEEQEVLIKLEAACEELSGARKKCADELSVQITHALLDLNFLHVVFEIQFSRTADYTPGGNDKIEFLISTNPGEPVRPLAKVASGGELSRIMLALKTILADKDETETLIFDEIDTGISGRTAQKVSEKMAWIGRNHQVICITHLPQIAAMSDHHFLIEKNVEDGETVTSIHALENEDSVREIARILGGAAITEHTIAAAVEMKELAQKQKNSSVK